MKNLFRKSTALGVAMLMTSTVSITAFALTKTGSSLGHANDKWEYGVEYCWYNWNAVSQYSNFYCKNAKHTATAIQKTKNKTYKVKKTAEKKKWAKADTGNHTGVIEWNSYYNHP